ncbi:DNA alkylation repair protein [Halarcobacter bivalviorum]|uniref:3-methyladenine DNA glycosylase n=1 Tax=Halarcobacter bivalviorum TaxID=663364 RepID=A0AAX2ABP0_9BACT|nr:DNA alkylation repair protein [Halarcobacter bivalviorum]AXH11763.1 3-methyladenine DNA glycosylase [Halarcobacter bivalviorum]RXK10891.1 DNA alkylation repair protein [Halarcobacter bivalviorum]
MAEQLKNVYTKEYIGNLANKIKEYYSSFDKEKFCKEIFDSSWESLELKQRMRHIAIVLNNNIKLEYKKQLEVLKFVSKYFYSFEAMFFQDFVEVYGLDDYEDSIKALEVFTLESSSEFAIRQFILKEEDKTMSQLKLWTKSENEHLRRLASEGCRPRLPWAVALPEFKKNPTKVLEILELLKNDKSKYVQKSVANNLNDISKDNPKLVIEFIQSNLGKTKELDWICKHAARTLLKKGDKEILVLFGYEKSKHVKIENFICDESLFIGDNLIFSFDLISEDEPLGKLRVEYIISYLKANGLYSNKIFVINQNEIKTFKKSFSKKQSFQNMTTRKHYKGKHKLSIVINSLIIKEHEFILK